MDIVLRHLEGSLNQWLAVNFGHSEYRNILSSIKGFRNGLVYGVRIRAPHAFVMVMLFGQGTIAGKLKTILRMIWTHAINLARFVSSYKMLLGFLRKRNRQYQSWHPFVAAFIPGYFVFGQDNGVNTQINLYLLSRIIYGLVKLGVEKRILIQPSFSVFPWFAALLWGIVLWLFENHAHVLQNSLQSSMTYLYHDSNVWTGIRDFIFGIE